MTISNNIYFTQQLRFRCARRASNETAVERNRSDLQKFFCYGDIVGTGYDAGSSFRTAFCFSGLDIREERVSSVILFA
jgi:hypothetical protein